MVKSFTTSQLVAFDIFMLQEVSWEWEVKCSTIISFRKNVRIELFGHLDSSHWISHFSKTESCCWNFRWNVLHAHFFIRQKSQRPFLMTLGLSYENLSQIKFFKNLSCLKMTGLHSFTESWSFFSFYMKTVNGRAQHKQKRELRKRLTIIQFQRVSIGSF